MPAKKKGFIKDELAGREKSEYFFAEISESKNAHLCGYSLMWNSVQDCCEVEKRGAVVGVYIPAFSVPCCTSLSSAIRFTSHQR